MLSCGAALTSGCSSDCNPLSLPKYWPFDPTIGPPGPSVAIRSHIENSSSGAFGAQACHSDGRARPCGNRDAFLRKPLHDVDQEGARTDRRRARRVVDADSVHPRDVDDDATASRVARIAVPAGPGHHANRVPPRPAHGAPDILRGVAEHDRAGPDVVEAGTVEAACRV